MFNNLGKIKLGYPLTIVITSLITIIIDSIVNNFGYSVVLTILATLFLTSMTIYVCVGMWYLICEFIKDYKANKRIMDNISQFKKVSKHKSYDTRPVIEQLDEVFNKKGGNNER